MCDSSKPKFDDKPNSTTYSSKSVEIVTTYPPDGWCTIEEGCRHRLPGLNSELTNIQGGLMEWEYDMEDPRYVPIEEMEKYHDAKEWLVELIHHIYVTGDVDAIEMALEEAIYPFGLKLPESDPVIKSNKSTYFDHAIEMIRGLKN